MSFSGFVNGCFYVLVNAKTERDRHDDERRVGDDAEYREHGERKKCNKSERQKQSRLLDISPVDEVDHCKHHHSKRRVIITLAHNAG